MFPVFAFSALLSGCGLFRVSRGEAELIRQAVSGLEAVEPASERKLLVFSKTRGFRHSSIKYCNRAVEIMGHQTGAFECVFSEDMGVFEAEYLRGFDAVCFNNSTRLRFDEAQRAALMEFVRGGKGIVSIHGATDSFYDWPQGAEMVGGTFDGHPWWFTGTWGFKVDQPGHPLTESLDAEGFKVSDEIYRHRPAGEEIRKRSTVLVSLDMSDNKTASKAKRPSDNDIPVSWIHRFGGGRVFHMGFGHNHEIYWNEAIMGHLLGGIQFACGDLDGKLKIKN